MSDDNIGFVEQLLSLNTKKWKNRPVANEKRTGRKERMSNDYYYQTNAKPFNLTLCQISSSLMHFENVIK